MTNTNQHLTNHRFTEFPLNPLLQQAIDDLGYEFCTPIQANTLPVIIENKNLIGQADTGTGKTATFLIATINNLLKNPANEHHKNDQPRALILAPTRELAIQIHKEALALIKHTDLETMVIFGGTNYQQQKKQMSQRCDILIATVGRIIDFYKQNLINFRFIQTLVLDEADRMLDMGFIKDVRYILRKLPPPTKRQNLLFSATINFKVKEFAYEMMDAPELISVETAHKDSSIAQKAYYVANDEKIALLIGLIKRDKPSRSIVFTNTKISAEDVTAYLKGNDISAELLSGDVPQKRRVNLVKEFGENKFSVLVATDVAARGLHIDDVTYVFNYDLPQDPEDYIHRIGRTGRIGADGNAVNFVCESYAFYLPDIESLLGNQIPIDSISEDMLAEVAPKAKIKRNTPRNFQSKKKSHAKKHKRPPHRQKNQQS